MIMSTQQKERPKQRKSVSSASASSSTTENKPPSNRLNGFYEDQERKRVKGVRTGQITSRTASTSPPGSESPKLTRRRIRKAVSTDVVEKASKTPTGHSKSETRNRAVVPRVKRSVPKPERQSAKIKRQGNLVDGQPLQRRRQALRSNPKPTRVAKPKPQRLRSRSWDWSGPALMVYFSFMMGIASVILHGLDLLIAWPFHQAAISYDIVFLICGAVLAAMSWHTYKERERYR